MRTKKGIFQFHLCRQIVFKRQVDIDTRSEAQLVETIITVAVHLAESRADNEATIERLGKRLC